MIESNRNSTSVETISEEVSAPVARSAETEVQSGVDAGTPFGAGEATEHGDSGGYAASGMTETLSAHSAYEPTDEANLKTATTGPSSAPGYGVINTADKETD